MDAMMLQLLNMKLHLPFKEVGTIKILLLVLLL